MNGWIAECLAKRCPEDWSGVEYNHDHLLFEKDGYQVYVKDEYVELVIDDPETGEDIVVLYFDHLPHQTPSFVAAVLWLMEHATKTVHESEHSNVAEFNSNI